MPPIPLPPLWPPERPGQPATEAGQRRPGRFRRSLGYVVSPLSTWSGVRAIRGSAASVGEAITEVRTATRRDPRFRTFPDGQFDLEATAFLLGSSVKELKRRLAARRRQSAFLAYGSFALAMASFGFWLVQAFGETPASIMFMLNAFGFGLVCLLTAFYQALVNYQIRSGRTETWRDFILTDHGFWPTP